MINRAKMAPAVLVLNINMSIWSIWILGLLFRTIINIYA